MINNSPRSGPAASSATSHTPTARCISPSCTASPTPPKQQHHSPSAKANQTQSTSISIRDRIHVGDIAKTTEDAFTAWVLDRSAGLDAIMLAPTRELVADLNRRAREHRLDHTATWSEVRLADGNQASVGDVIITRRNDRRLRITATDWVKTATDGPSSVSAGALT